MPDWAHDEAIEQAHTWVVGQAREDPELRSRLTAEQVSRLDRARGACGGGYSAASHTEAIACWGEQAVTVAGPGPWRLLRGSWRGR